MRQLAGLEDWVAERFQRHAGDADMVRQELLAEKGIALSLRTIERAVAPLRRGLAATPLAQSPEAVPVLRPLLPTAERLLPYLRRIDLTRFYSNHGPLSVELEARLAQTFGLPVGGLVCTSSGTSALVGAILATAGRATPERRLAIVPALTFAATACAAEACGYQPYFADVDSESWMLDPGQLINHCQRQRIGLVIPVAPFGRPVPQASWQRFCEATGIPVVIDGAASFAGLAEQSGALLGAVPVAISFHATKPFATGEGGAVATRDLPLAERIGQALNFGIAGIRDCRIASTNGKMSEYHAAVGLAELDGWLEKSAALQRVAEHYQRCLARAGLSGQFHGAPDIGLNHALFRCRDVAEAKRIGRRLGEDGIEFRLWYGMGVHRQSYYADIPHDRLEVTDRIAPCLLGLPMAPDFAESTIERVVRSLAGATQF